MIAAFFDAVDALCKKHGVSISHEDGHGSFLIEPYNHLNIDWLRNADNHLPDNFKAPEIEDDERDMRAQDAVTLRDYFAVRALPLVAPGHCDGRVAVGVIWVTREHFDGLSDDAYALADAMLKARQR